MPIMPAGGVRYSNFPIFKAGPTSSGNDAREWDNKQVARLVTHTQAALKAGGLNIPLIIGHNESGVEKPAMGLIIGLHKAWKSFPNEETGKRSKILTVNADIVMNPEMNRLYKEGKYPSVSVEIHEKHVLPAAPGEKPTEFPFVFSALAFLGGSKPAHAMNFSSDTAAVSYPAFFAHDTDHEGSVFMYRVNEQITTEGDMPAENKGGNFAPEDVLAALQAVADIVNPVLEAAVTEEPVEEEATEPPAEQNATEDAPVKPDESGLQAKLDTLTTAIQALTADYSAKDKVSKADEEYAAHGNGVTREMWDPIATKHGALKAAEMFSATPTGPPKGKTPASGQTETGELAIKAEMERLRTEYSHYYGTKSEEQLRRFAVTNLSKNRATAGSN